MFLREKARIVAERVAERIREVTPVGFGYWGPVWGLVAMPSDVFMDALAEWQTEDSPSTRTKVQAASTDLITAWAEAALLWEDEGRPILEEIHHRQVEAGVGELGSRTSIESSSKASACPPQPR